MHRLLDHILIITALTLAVVCIALGIIGFYAL